MDLDINEIAKIIGVPVQAWAGNCHGVSEALVKSGLLDQWGGERATYTLMRGHWIGPIAPGSHFGYMRSLPFVPHSWIQTRHLAFPVLERSRRHIDEPMEQTIKVTHDPIIDPTRFAFEAAPPYIYLGGNDRYDAGGNVWREIVEPELRPFNPATNPINLILPVETHKWIRVQLDQYETGRTYPFCIYTIELVLWLANLSLFRLGKHARPIFHAIVQAGHAAAIPMDNRAIVLG
jgi:hypothetical protein